MKTRSAAAKGGAPAAAVLPVLQQPRTNAYKKQSISLLTLDFPRLSVDATRRTFDHCNHSFAATHLILSSVTDYLDEENDEGEQRKNILKLAPFLKNTKRIVLKADRKIPASFSLNDPTLLAELNEIPEMNTKKKRTIEIETKRGDDDDTKDALESRFECACCFDDECLFDTMCQCNEGHLICTECLRRYVDEQLDGKGVGHLECLDMEAIPKCTATYSSTQLGRAFSPKSLQKVEEKMFRFCFENADMDDGCQCPKCNDLFFLPNAISDDVSCPGCNHAFCRLCNEAPHKSKTCEDAKAEKENLNAHASAAEAMTAAVVRKCPKCKKPFFKEEGCNKMTCPSCKTKSCYLCRQHIKDYSHFCRTPHCKHDSCGKCILYTNAKEDDRLARREVAFAEQKKADGKGAAELVGGLLSPPRPPPKKKPRRPLQPVRQDNANRQLEQPPRPLQQPERNAAAVHQIAPPRVQAAERQNNNRGQVEAPQQVDPQQNEHAVQPEENEEEEGAWCIIS